MYSIKLVLLQIRVLLQERTNQDKQLCQREDEITKLEGRLNNAQTDRSSLMAKVASLEKAIKDANKSNDLLKTKVQERYKKIIGDGGFVVVVGFQR